MTHILIRLVFLFTMTNFSVAAIKAQTTTETDELFRAGRYLEALPALEQIARKAPTNTTYQYQYGYALYQLGQYNKAIEPLSIAAKRQRKALLSQAKCLYMLYRFSEANRVIEAYEAFSNKRQTEVDHKEIKQIKVRIARGLRMLENSELVTVIDSVIVDSASMLSAFRLSSNAGTIAMASSLLTQRVFQTSSGAAHINGLKDRAILSLPTPEKGLDLGTLFRLGKQWSDFNPLTEVNTPANENFPFGRQDGRTLVFARDGEEGLGGYDLYMTRIGADGRYLKATPLGMPFNSPYNDFFVAYDEEKKLGFLASDRFQPEGRVCIYTFVIDNEARLIPSNDEDTRRTLASLSVIAATQDENTDYTNLQAQSNLSDTQQTNNPSLAQEISFLIGTKRYTRWTDFQSVEARNLYRQASQIAKELLAAEQRLEHMRRMYHSASERNRNTLSKEILDLERHTQDMRTHIENLTIQARRIEGGTPQR